jgi:A/G-specific adenine glycosylase
VDKRRHAGHLLAWYDRHGRALPWRVRGAHPEPYHVLLSEMMLQQTVVRTVIPYFAAFTHRWPTLADLAAAPLDDILAAWAGLGYYARARNLHALARTVAARHGGVLPSDEGELLALPGIGPYTAAAIRAIAFDQPAAVVDGNVERVVARLYDIHTPLPTAKPVLRQRAAELTPARRPGDYAQAMMDLGATVCTPQRPDCGVCPLAGECAAHAAGTAALLPQRGAKPERPLRRAIAFIALREDGALLLRRRPDTGLLAKMMEVPSTPWCEHDAERPEPAGHAPLAALWRRVPGVVAHVFTHFRLEAEVWRAEVTVAADLSPAAVPERCKWVAAADLADQALPSVMRKLIRHGLGG